MECEQGYIGGFPAFFVKAIALQINAALVELHRKSAAYTTEWLTKLIKALSSMLLMITLILGIVHFVTSLAIKTMTDMALIIPSTLV